MGGTNFHPKLERDFCLDGDRRRGRKKVLSITAVRGKARLEIGRAAEASGQM